MVEQTLALWYSEDPYEGVIDYEYILFQQEQELLLREVEMLELDDSEYPTEEEYNEIKLGE